MPRKSAAKAATPKPATPKTPVVVEKETPNRRGGRKSAAVKTPAKPASTPTEPKRSRRSSTAAQTAASQADGRGKTRSRTNRSSSNSSERKSSQDESVDRGSPSPRPSRRPKKEVNYEESEGEDENAVKPPQTEEDYEADEAEEEVENDSDSLESTSKKKGKLKPSPPQVKPRGRAKGRPKANSSPPRPSRSPRKKKGKESEEEEEEEEKEEVEEDAVDAPAAPSRRGRNAAAEKVVKEEKPKGGTRSRRSPAAAVATPSPRPGRAVRQRKAPSTEEKETPKPVRTSARSRKAKVEETKDEEEEDEVMDEEKEEDEEGGEEKDGKGVEKKEDTKKRKLEEEQEEKSESKRSKVEDKTEDKPDEEGEKEEADEEPEESMEVDDAEDKDLKSDKETKENVEQKKVGSDEKPDTQSKKQDEDKEEEELEKETSEHPKADDHKETKEAEVAEEEDEEEEDEEEEEEEEKEVPAVKSSTKENDVAPMEEEASDAADGKTSTDDHPSTPVKEVETSKPVEQCNPQPNQKPAELKPSPEKHTSDIPEVKGPSDSHSKPAPVTPECSKPENKERLQNSPTKSHDNVNGTPPQSEETPKPITHTSEPTQMLPSSAMELNQQQNLSPAKPEVERVRISANGHLAESGDAQNNCSVGLFHGRSYLHNRHPSAEVLSRIRDRTFGLVSFNIPSGKIDEKFLLDLKTLSSDIVCLQGITPEQFSQHLQPSLDALGYKGTFAQDSGKAVATFYRASALHLKNQRSLPLKQTIGKDLECSLSSGEGPAVAERLPPCGQVLFTHLGLTQSTRGLTVANVLVPPSDVSIQALQMSCLAREAILFLESAGLGSSVPLVLCGAFNMQQKEAAYQLLRDGYLSNEMIEALQSKKDIRVPGRDEDTSLVNLLWKSFQHSTAGLKSCYSAVTGQEVEFPNQGSQSTSPDLIWFSSDSLTPLGVLEVPLTPTPGLHLPLKADLAFNY